MDSPTLSFSRPTSHQNTKHQMLPYPLSEIRRVTTTHNTHCLSHLLCLPFQQWNKQCTYVRNNDSDLQVMFSAGISIVTSTHKPNYVETHYKLKTVCLLENVRVNCHFVSWWQSEDIIIVAILIDPRSRAEGWAHMLTPPLPAAAWLQPACSSCGLQKVTASLAPQSLSSLAVPPNPSSPQFSGEPGKQVVARNNTIAPKTQTAEAHAARAQLRPMGVTPQRWKLHPPIPQMGREAGRHG